MKTLNRILLAGLFSILAFSALAESTTNPVPRDVKWVARHEGFVQIAKKGGVDLLFMGDSITDFWRNRGSNVWDKYYAPRNAANFGISADRTEHVLWRMDNGELEGIKPKVVVLMIGTNNTGKERDGKTPRNQPPEVIQAEREAHGEHHEREGSGDPRPAEPREGRRMQQRRDNADGEPDGVEAGEAGEKLLHGVPVIVAGARR